MALRDLFKRKKPTVKEKKEKKLAKEQKEVKEVKKEPSKTLKKKVLSDLPYRIIKGPHITEKATDLAGKNQYVFKVSLVANKIEIKKVVEQLYDVDVVSVRIIKVPRKRRVLGRISGWKKGYKKAIVRIKEGQTIEELSH